MPKENKPKLNPKQELFAQLYTRNSQMFGNATLSYAEAYGYDLDSLSDEIPKDQPTAKSERDKAYNVCAVEAQRLLRNPNVQDRLTVLLNEMLRDDIIDRELAKTILQDHKLESKIAAIREYNKLKQRITEKVEHTGSLPFNLTITQKDGGATH
jgi:hypothetical protein